MTRPRIFLAASAALVVAGLLACANSEEAASGAGPGSVLPAPDATSDASLPTPADGGDGGADGSATSWPFTSVVLPIDARYHLLGIWGSGANDVWAVGSAGAIVHFDGAAWAAAPSPTVQALSAVWGPSADDVWAVSSAGVILRRRSVGGATAAWLQQPAIDGNNPWHALAVRGFGASQLLVVGSGLIGNADEGQPVSSVIGSGRALADGGVAWTETPGCLFCSDLHALWGTGPNDIWVVGENGSAQHASASDDAGAPRWVGTQSATTRTLTALWGSTASDVWAVGAGGTVLHWTNAPSQRWDVVSSGTDADLNAIWGSGPNDIWAVGDDATVIHFDGTSWSRRVAQIAAPNDGATLNGVWGSGPEDVWIVGRGVVLHSTKGGM